jgi:carboxyl-terminal processing protease
MKLKQSFGLCFAFIFFFSTFAACAVPSQDTGYDTNKAHLLSYIIGQELQRNHFSHKPMDDTLSKEAFSLYLKQVDPRKQFYLQQDIDELQQFSTKLDDEMRDGQIIFPQVAETLLKTRVLTVQKFMDEFAVQDFDLNKKEFVESDIKKLKYCQSDAELKARWQKSIQYQIVSQYLNRDAVNDAKKSLDTAKETPPKSEKELVKEAKEKVIKTNRELLTRMLKREPKEQYDRFFSIIARAYDPHTDFMPPTEKEDFDIHMRGSLEGIGAELQEEDGFIKVKRIIPGGAASRQKQLIAHDVILMVAQGKGDPVDITDMRINDAVQLIRGPKGSEVRLTVKKVDGQVSVISIIRDVVQLEETFVKSAIVEGSHHDKYGYIKIPTFYRDFQEEGHGSEGRNVSDDVKKSLAEISKTNTRGLIIDLRNNGGGALVDAVKIAGFFIKNGPVVQIKSSDDKAEVLYDYDNGVYYDGPIIVLINRFSASASEILAAALQDYHRALIVGSDHSYGKGTVQTLINLDNELPLLNFNLDKYKPLGALKITTQKFYRITGGSTQDKGVQSDIVLPDAFSSSEIGERYDENALPWDTIPPASYDKWGNFSFNIKQLIPASQVRIKGDKKFIEIEKEAEEGKERIKNSMIPIDLASVKRERDRTIALRKNAAMPGHGFDSEDDDTTPPDHVLTPQEEMKRLVDSLHTDPYVLESLSLMEQSDSSKADTGVIGAVTKSAQ